MLTLLKMHTAPRRIRPPDGDGTVLGQSPLPGEPLTAQTDITLDLATLPPPGSPGATMPKVVGLSADDAIRRLAQSKLKIHSIQRMDIDGAEPGEIVAQQPSFGAPVGAGIPIDLYVAMSPKSGSTGAKHGNFSAAPLALAPRVTPALQTPPAVQDRSWPQWTLWIGLGSAGVALLALLALLRNPKLRTQTDQAINLEHRSPVQLLRAVDRAPVPWKNGGGVTREIAAWPARSDLDSFDWRVSMATVETGGPFSNFPGIDRVLVVLEGELVLTINDGADLTIDSRSEPAAFPGDAAVIAKTPSAPVTDLNVMTRRGRASATVFAAPKTPPPDPFDWLLLLSRREALSVHAYGDLFHLSENDALMIAGGDVAALEIESTEAFDHLLILISSSDR